MIGRNKDGVLFYSVRYKDRMGVDVQKKEQNKDWKTKKEAKEAMDRFLLSVTGSIDRITLGQLYRLFVDDRAGRVKLRTAYAFDNVYNTHIKPTFEKVVISEIAPRHITTWQNDLKMKGYKNTYLLMIQEHLCRILNFGVRFGYIDKSPFVNRFAKDITQRKVEMTFWTIDEFNKFIQKIDNDTYYAFFMTLYWTGIRRGEAIALQIRDVNFTDNTLRISKTYDSVHKVTTTPDTFRGGS